MTRVEKLEAAYRAAAALRRALIDITPLSRCLCVARPAVATYDAAIAALSDKSTNGIDKLPRQGYNEVVAPTNDQIEDTK